MKIFAYLPDSDEITGAPRRLINLAKAVRPLGVDMRLLLSKDNKLMNEATISGVKVLKIETPNILKEEGRDIFSKPLMVKFKILVALIFYNFDIFRKLRKAKATIFWVRGSKGILFSGLGAWCSRSKIIWDVDYEITTNRIIKIIQSFALYISDGVLLQYPEAEKLIFNKKLVDKYKEKFKPIIPGIDLDELREYKLEREKYLNSKVENDKYTVLHVGTICDRKNQAYILNLLSRKNIKNNWEVYFAGGIHDKEYYQSLTNFIIENNLTSSVKFLGWRDDIQSIMTKADLLVLPSKDEGVPNTIQEAMYIGLPVIVSDVGGMKQIVEDGKTGWLIDLQEPENWLAVLHKCSADKNFANNIGANASTYAQEHFGLRTWGKLYLEKIRETS